MKYIQARILPNEYLEIKKFAVEHGLEMNELLVTAIKSYIKYKEKEEEILKTTQEVLASLTPQQGENKI